MPQDRKKQSFLYRLNFLSFLILGGLIGGIIASKSYALSNLKVGDVAIDFKLPDLSGKEVTLSDFKGKVLVVVFGELYQRNSISAFKDLEKINDEGVFPEKEVEIVVIITEDASEKELLAKKESLRIPFRLLIDKYMKYYGECGVIALPSTIIVNKEGKVSFALSGYSFNYPDLIRAALQQALGRITKEEFDALSKPIKKDKPELLKARRLVSLAQQLMKRGFLDISLEKYKEALKLRPNLEEAVVGIGNVYLERKEYEKAEEKFRNAIKNDSKSLGARMGIAKIHTIRGELEQAEKALLEILISDSDDARVHFLLGEVYEKKGDVKKAMKHFKESAQILSRREPSY